MKKFFCLHGLPRAGNTLLGSIINQNPKVAVTANSLIADMLGELYLLKHTDIFKNFPDHKKQNKNDVDKWITWSGACKVYCD